MFSEEIFVNVVLMLLCYVYTLFIIFVSIKMNKLLNISKRDPRKFLHAMIGNFPFIARAFVR
jgi:hypothetical protein